jgi:mono/diheme cytochrome c family protein
VALIRQTLVASVLAVVALLACPVAAEEPGAPSIEAASSVFEGVFTEAQAQRGAAVYPGPCGKCHGFKLDGAADDPDMPSTPPIGGTKFLRNWEGRSLATLYEYTRTTMPENNPGFLSDQEYADLVAYMLFASAVPPGREELGTDSRRLAGVVIRRRRGPAADPD